MRKEFVTCTLTLHASIAHLASRDDFPAPGSAITAIVFLLLLISDSSSSLLGFRLSRFSSWFIFPQDSSKSDCEMCPSPKLRMRSYSWSLPNTVAPFCSRTNPWQNCSGKWEFTRFLRYNYTLNNNVEHFEKIEWFLTLMKHHIISPLLLATLWCRKVIDMILIQWGSFDVSNNGALLYRS